jgi:Glycosyltransferase family 87
VRRTTAFALLVLAAGWAATLWIAPFSDERVNDLFVYRVFSEPVLNGALPYRDVFLEYPPLAAPAIALPGLAGEGEGVFRVAFAVWTLLLAGGVVLLCGALAARTGGDPRRALLASAAMPLLLGALVRTHFDLAPVALLLAALWLLLDGRPRPGMALLGLGAMTKGFPLLAALVALAWLAARVDRRTLLEAGAALLAALVAPALAAVAIAPGGALDAVEYHVQRPVQVESLPAAGALLLDAVGAGEAESVKSHRSDGIKHPAAGGLAGAGLLATVALVALAIAAGRPQPVSRLRAVRGARASGGDAAPPPPGDARRLVLAALTAVLAFAALGKVLSPQYMLWLVPLGALAVSWRLRALAWSLAGAAALTQIEFPARYLDLVAREPFAVAVVMARNLLLLVALGLALRELLRAGHQQLLDGERPAAAVALDEHPVEPRILV